MTLLDKARRRRLEALAIVALRRGIRARQGAGAALPAA